MYFDDHPPAHFHARYGEFEAQVEIANGQVIHGSLPRRAAGMVEEWAQLRRAELETAWERAMAEQPLGRIDPLP
jgi:hypothetical protein